jgi:hypothetical protein
MKSVTNGNGRAKLHARTRHGKKKSKAKRTKSQMNADCLVNQRYLILDIEIRKQNQRNIFELIWIDTMLMNKSQKKERKKERERER